MMIRKRDGRVVEFDETKITDAIFEAAKSVGGADRQLAMELTLNVLKALKNENKQTVDVEHIQDIVEKVLIESGQFPLISLPQCPSAHCESCAYQFF